MMQQPIRRSSQPKYRPIRRYPWTLLAHRYRKVGILWDNARDLLIGMARDVIRGGELRAQPAARLVELADRPAGAAGVDAAEASVGSRWCLFAAYSPRSAVTDMMIAQLRAYQQAGFANVFVTMSKTISREDMARLREVCTHVLHRRSFGRDFGAWVHAARLLGQQLRNSDHLLLANDSNLGPIQPLQPWLDAALARDGVVGLTESLGGGSHLQSYFLLANGAAAVNAVLDFLTAMKLSHSKWLMIQRGEIAFSETLRRGGHFVGAILDHETLEDAAISDREFQAELEVMFPDLFHGLELPDARKLAPEDREAELTRAKAYQRYLLRSRLFLLPVNPSHQLNSLLLKHFKFPFIKAELVVKNPGMVPSAPDWRYVITAQSPVTERMIEDHLATLS